MDVNEQNDIFINKIELVVCRDNLPGNEYRNYCEGRGICGLVVAISGKSTYILKDGTEWEITAGEAALFSENIAYVIANKGTEPFAHYTINFSLSPGSSFDSDMVIKPVNFSDFAKKCETLLHFWRSGAPTSRLRCTAVLYELIADVLENNLIDSVGAEMYHMVLPAIHYIDENYYMEITLDRLARLCVMSKTNFRRVFSAVCGISPIQYLLEVRIRRANELLQQSSHTVSEIAQLCGFKDVEHFCRTFKKRTGNTAGQIRSYGKIKTEKEREYDHDKHERFKKLC